MNDIIPELSKSTKQDQSTVTNAWELAKAQAKAEYSETDEEYYPRVVSLTKQFLKPKQNQDSMSPNEQESKFTEPEDAHTTTSMFRNPPPTSTMQPKQEEILDLSDKYYRNPKYSQSSMIFDLIAGLKTKNLNDDEIIHSLVFRLKCSFEEANLILDIYRKANDEPIVGVPPITPEETVDIIMNDTMQQMSPYYEGTQKLYEIKGLEYMDWKAKSNNRNATVRFLILDKMYQMEFTHAVEGTANWNYEWNPVTKQGITSVLLISVEQLNGDYNNLKLSVNKTNLSLENKDALIKVMLKALEEYLDKYNKMKNFQYIFLQAESLPRYDFLKEFTPKLCKKYSKLNHSEEVSKLISKSTVRYFAIKNGSAKLKEEEGGDFSGTVSSDSFDSAPFDAGRTRDDWKDDWDSQKEKKPRNKKKNKRFVDINLTYL
jgi:hypothetical protein